MSYENFFGAKTSETLFISFENCRKMREGSLESARRLTRESREYPIIKSSNWIPVIGHPRDRASITLKIDARRANHDREFYYRYDQCRNPLGS